ncbi:MAG: hypothetical protein KC503_37670 [Myxococcales bacterium]|nr:hypothetical protein [Myxococcales bacterium]
MNATKFWMLIYLASAMLGTGVGFLLRYWIEDAHSDSTNREPDADADARMLFLSRIGDCVCS